MNLSDPNTIEAVWQKGLIILGSSPQEWRQDVFGGFMYRWAYGNRASAYGWEIDHILPVSQGGSDNLLNLRPLYWGNNAQRPY